jgi:hypothetical protein
MSMSCGGSMMRANLQPLAHLVDAAAEQWLLAEAGNAVSQETARREISQSFWIGDRPELTFHGQKFLLTISRSETLSTPAEPHYLVSVHKIALNG